MRALASHWPSILAAIWAIGTAIGLGLLVNVNLAAWRLVRTATEPSDPSWSEMAGVLAAQLGVRRRVAVRISDRIAVPVTAGWLRPVILLPTDCDGWPAPRRRMVLIHELSHVARGDVLWQIAAKLACVIYWLHPLVWLAARRMRVEREAACDDAVLRDVERPSEYASLLLDVAASLANRPIGMSTAAIAMACGRSVEERIRWIVQPGRCRLPIGRRTAMLFSAGAVLIVLGLGSVSIFAGPPAPAVAASGLPVDSDGKASAEKTDGQVTFAGLCHDDQGRPIAGAEVVLYRVDLMGNRTQRLLQTERTNKDGKFRFAPVDDLSKGMPAWQRALPQAAPYEIHARATGRATVGEFVPQSSIDSGHIDMRMREGATLSGRVTGPDGKPVKGATVWAIGLIKPIPGIGCATTDAAGRFEIQDLGKIDMTKPPAGTTTWQTGMPLHISCPGFGDKRVEYGKVPGTVDVQLERAAVVEGRVVYGDQGKPAAGVRVQFQGIKDGAFDRAVTDADGRYRFDSLGLTSTTFGPSKMATRCGQLIHSRPCPARRRAVADLRLVRGGFIVGHVVDAETGQPFYPSDAKAPPWFRPDVALYGPSRPRSGPACEGDADPGRRIVQYSCGSRQQLRVLANLRSLLRLCHQRQWMLMWPRGKRSLLTSKCEGQPRPNPEKSEAAAKPITAAAPTVTAKPVAGATNSDGVSEQHELEEFQESLCTGRGRSVQACRAAFPTRSPGLLPAVVAWPSRKHAQRPRRNVLPLARRQAGELVNDIRRTGPPRNSPVSCRHLSTGD